MAKRKQKGAKHVPAPRWQPDTGKVPRTAAGIAPGEQYPAWRVALLELVEPYGWHRLDRDKLLEIQRKLGQHEGRTWHEILGRSSHMVAKKDLAKGAQKRLEDLKLDDVDELVSLRLSGKERVWGILQGNVLRLLWWDPDHQVCLSKKKHT